MPFDVLFDINIDFGGYFSQNPSIWGQNPIYLMQKQTLYSFLVSSFVYLEHIGIQFIEKLTGKIVSCV